MTGCSAPPGCWSASRCCCSGERCGVARPEPLDRLVRRRRRIVLDRPVCRLPRRGDRPHLSGAVARRCGRAHARHSVPRGYLGELRSAPALIPVQCQRGWRWWFALGHSPHAGPGDRAPSGGADVARLRRAGGADGGAARRWAERHPGDAAGRHLRGHRRRGVPAARAHLRVGRGDRRAAGSRQPDRLGLLRHGPAHLRPPCHLAVRGRRPEHRPPPAGIDGSGRDQQRDG